MIKAPTSKILEVATNTPIRPKIANMVRIAKDSRNTKGIVMIAGTTVTILQGLTELTMIEIVELSMYNVKEIMSTNRLEPKSF